MKDWIVPVISGDISHVNASHISAGAVAKPLDNKSLLGTQGPMGNASTLQAQGSVVAPQAVPPEKGSSGNWEIIQRDLGALEKFGKQCGAMMKMKTADPAALEAFMKKKLGDKNFMNFCATNNILVRNDLKKWEGNNTYKPLAQNKLQEGDTNRTLLNVEDPEGGLRFYLLDKYEAVTAVVAPPRTAEETRRPLLVNTDTCKKVVFRYDYDYIVDVEQELKLIIFSWDDIQESSREEIIMAEIMKFKDCCLRAFAQVTHEIGVVEAIPLSYNPYERKKNLADEIGQGRENH